MTTEKKIHVLTTEINQRVSVIDVLAELESCSASMVSQLETTIADLKFNLNKMESALADLAGSGMAKEHEDHEQI